MSYIVESDASTSRRSRRRRALVTLVVIVLMLFSAFWYAYSYYQASGRPSALPTTTCPPKPGAKKPASITVNVYNATDRNGLAARTATALRQRGFKVSTVANDPLQKTVAGPAEVRHGRSGAAAGKVVAALVKGAKSIQDGRPDASVDLVLGEKFTALVPVARKPPPATKQPTPADTASQRPTATASPKPSVKPTARSTTPGKAAPRTTTPAC